MSDILIAEGDGVLSISFNRPHKRNALTHAMYCEMAAALADADTSGRIRCVLLAGSTEVFCAGNDTTDLRARPRAAGEASPAHTFLGALAELSKPLIACVCGPAVGIGATMLGHSDAVYAGDNARFSYPFTALGLCPEAASTMLLPMTVGRLRAAEALLFGAFIPAQDALSMGLVNRVLPAAEALAYARDRAVTLASRDAASVTGTKRLMKRATATAVKNQMLRERLLFRQLLAAAESPEATRKRETS